jgi:hypothetical protein
MGSNTIDFFEKQAISTAHTLMQAIPLTTIILDNWRGYRLIYDGPAVTNCPPSCNACPLFVAVGVDPKPIPENVLLISLYSASLKDMALFPGKQRMLNCKTLLQYQDCFVVWLVEKCRTQNEIDEELTLIRDFRIIYHQGAGDLISFEKQVKQQIVQKSLRKIKRHRDQWIRINNAAKKFGLIT